MARADERLAALARDIGPRPATREGEHDAADYIRDVLDSKDAFVEFQRIRSPRTCSVTYLIYFFGAVIIAVLAQPFSPWAWAWPWTALAAIVLGGFFYLELDTRQVVSRLMPKGQSRNVVGRMHASAGGPATVVVILAHYDSARAALPFSPRMVGRFRLAFLATAGAVWTICVLAVVRAGVGLAGAGSSPASTYIGYAMLALAVCLLFPIAIYVHREVAMPFVDGANDNASGVVAMLEVMERMATARSQSRPSAADSGQRVDSEQAAGGGPSGGPITLSGGYAPDGPGGDGGPSDGSADPDDPPSEKAGESPDSGERAAPDSEQDWGDVALTDWLGVDRHWDIRREGQALGDYSAIGRQGEGDATAGEQPPAEPQPPEEQAFERLAGPVPQQQIDVVEAPDLAFETGRRHGPDEEPSGGRGREPGLDDKEVWFVATGCGEAGTVGMIEFLKRYSTRLRDAYFINLDSLGSGRLAFVSDEGMVRSRGADRVLLAASREVADIKGFDIVAHPYHLLTTDATAAMIRGHRAMSVMAFDEKGRLPNWHWATDTVERVHIENIESAADFVFELVKVL